MPMSWRLVVVLLLFFVIVVPGCSAAAVESDVSSPGPRDVGTDRECTLLGVAATDGSCSAEWVCRDAGQVLLACETSDGGVPCQCVSDGGLKNVDATPSSCDEPTVGTFAQGACGWGGP
jgi:hypothetical protein